MEPAAHQQALRMLARFDRLYAKNLRAHPRIKDDKDVTPADFAKYHVVLFGDPGSNRWLAKINGKSPLKWTKQSVRYSRSNTPSADHLPAHDLSEPAQSTEYVVFNTGMTIDDREYAGEYPMPRLGDFAMLKVKEGADFPDTAEAGLFDEKWRASRNASGTSPDRDLRIPQTRDKVPKSRIAMKRRKFFRTMAAAPLAPALIGAADRAGEQQSGATSPAPPPLWIATYLAGSLNRTPTAAAAADSNRDRGSRRSRGHVAEILQRDPICDAAKAERHYPDACLSTERPGALEAGAPEFLDFLISESLGTAAALLQGLDLLNAESKKRFSKNFADADAQRSRRCSRP